MTYKESLIKIIDILKEAALLEQLAEECAELSKSALKLARIIRGENYTPITKTEAIESLQEETADVRVCLEIIKMVYDLETIAIERSKVERWLNRLMDCVS